jgi:hypothetical protein
VAHGEAEAKFVGALIEQQDGEDLVVDDLAHQFGHALEQGVEIERGVHHVGHLEQEGIDAGGGALFQRRGFGGRGHGEVSSHDNRGECGCRAPRMASF